MTLLELLQQYELDHPLAPTTVATMRYSCASLSEFLGSVATLDDLNSATISRFVAASAARYRPRTIRGKRGDLMVLWRYAAMLGMCPPPCRPVRKVKVPAPAPRAWTTEEMARVVLAARSLRGYFPTGVKRSLYYEALIRTAYETGLRRSDLWLLTLRDVRDNGIVTVIQHKTGRRHDAILGAGTVALLRQLDAERRRLGIPGEQVLAPHTEKRSVYLAFGRICAAAQVRKGALQMIRRTAATAVERELPGAAARFLGHASPGMVRHYVDESVAHTVLSPPRLAL